jgi:hypothetical protein
VNEPSADRSFSPWALLLVLVCTAGVISTFVWVNDGGLFRSPPPSPEPVTRTILRQWDIDLPNRAMTLLMQKEDGELQGVLVSATSFPDWHLSRSRAEQLARDSADAGRSYAEESVSSRDNYDLIIRLFQSDGSPSHLHFSIQFMDQEIPVAENPTVAWPFAE